jgi:hypothetical protein
MLLHVKVTVHPLTIAVGRVPCELNCDRAWTRRRRGYRDRGSRCRAPRPCRAVYRDEQELTERVNEYLLPAIQDGGVAIVVATPDHRQSFERYLADVGVEAAAAPARGAYLALDASQTMRGFMVADRPDPAGFWQAISPMLRQTARAGRPVRVFGEMVALLWDAGLIDAAIEVEAMWNELGAQYPFSLLCAYPAQPAACADQLDALTEVCRAHTQVTGVPPEAG